MHKRILDLDDGVVRQRRLVRRLRPDVVPLGEWGPRLRLGCGHRSFERFERRLEELTGSALDAGPVLSYCGSGDFHHVSLALVRRLPGPCNLLVVDNHPDWMRGIPFLHCGTWLYHAARLPHVRRVFHVGGEVDFDNVWRWAAPWRLLRAGKIRVFPAVRPFRGRRWAAVPHSPLRRLPQLDADRERVEELLDPLRAELASCPLYVSLDKDVLGADEAIVNWDSGRLVRAEVLRVLCAFLGASAGVAGVDVVGDWSPVRVAGPLRRALHHTEHAALNVDPDEATRANEALNLALLEGLASHLGVGAPAVRRAA
jgi:hypothetical protein